MSKEEARTLAQVIAEHIDQILEGVRHTAVVEAREGEAAPHIAIVITVNPRFIPQLLGFCRRNPDALIMHLSEKPCEPCEPPS